MAINPHELESAPAPHTFPEAQQSGNLPRTVFIVGALAAAFTLSGTEFDAKSTDRGNALPDVSAQEAEGAEKLRDSGGDRREDCTTIRRKANDVYVGMACVANGDRFTRINQYPKEKGWVYGVVAVNGWERVKAKEGQTERIPRTYHKCGYVRQGVLPSRKPRSRAITHCKDYYKGFSTRAGVYFKDFNCPGIIACKSGTFHSPPAKACTSDLKTSWRNYASDEPSPFNVFGTGNGAFNGRLKGNVKNSIHYRAAVVPESKGREAIVIRGINSWAFLNGKCVAGRYRQIGGTCTNKNQTRDSRGRKICGTLNRTEDGEIKPLAKQRSFNATHR